MPKLIDTNKEDLGQILKKLKIAEDFCRPYFERAKRFYKLYRIGSSTPKDKWPLVNRVLGRDTFSFIEDSTALLVRTLFAHEPFLSIIPRKRIASIELGKRIETALAHVISFPDTEFFPEYVDFTKTGCIYGTSHLMVTPHFILRGEGKRTCDRLQIDSRDFWDVLPEPYAKRSTRTAWKFLRDSSVYPEELIASEKDGTYKNVTKDGIFDIPNKSNASDYDIAWHKTLLREIGLEDYIPTAQEQIEILHFLQDGHIVTIANRIKIIRDSRKEKKPYPFDDPTVSYNYVTVPHEYFGMGIPEILEILQEDKNLIRSQRRENVDVILNKILKIRMGGIAEEYMDAYRSYAGAKWPVDRMDDVEQMDMTDVTQSSVEEIKQSRWEMEDALSFWGYARGMTPTHREQPTTVQTLQQASFNRPDLSVKITEFSTLRQFAKKVLLLMHEYMSSGQFNDLVEEDEDWGKKFKALSKDDLMYLYPCQPVGSTVTHIKEIRQQQFQAAFAAIAPLIENPQLMANNIEPFTVNLYRAYKTFYDELPIKNVDEILILLKKQQQQQPAPNFMGQVQELGKVPYGI